MGCQPFPALLVKLLLCRLVPASPIPPSPSCSCAPLPILHPHLASLHTHELPQVPLPKNQATLYVYQRFGPWSLPPGFHGRWEHKENRIDKARVHVYVRYQELAKMAEIVDEKHHLRDWIRGAGKEEKLRRDSYKQIIRNRKTLADQGRMKVK